MIVATFAVVGLYFVLPDSLRIGSASAIALVVAVLVIAATIARLRGQHTANAVLAYAVLAVLTVGLLFGVGALVAAVVKHTERAPDLLRSASALWATNILVFATWYWRLDGGGPNERESNDAHVEGAFLFPQMAFEGPGEGVASIASETSWRPGFVDYLFVSFNTSTAFSPTDVPVLSRWAKLASMLQSLISLVTVVLLAARAVNML